MAHKNMVDIEISVIVPVYNAEKYIEKAITSIVNQKFVQEIIIVNDNSVDNSMAMIAKLKNQYPDLIQIVEHKNPTNLGAGKTRNLGIEAARNEWIAFLDVDDYYYPNRFINAFQVIKNNPDADGIYEAVENVYSDDDAYDRFKQTRPIHIANNKNDYRHDLFTVYESVPPEHLFKALMDGDKGFFHFNGVLIKKQLLVKAGYLDEDLMLTQDTDLFLKLALIGKLFPGSLSTPVAGRLVHETNRVYSTDANLQCYRILGTLRLLNYAKDRNLSKEVLNIIREKNIKLCASEILKWDIYKYYRIKYFIISLVYPFLMKRFLNRQCKKSLQSINEKAA